MPQATLTVSINRALDKLILYTFFIEGIKFFKMQLYNNDDRVQQEKYVEITENVLFEIITNDEYESIVKANLN